MYIVLSGEEDESEARQLVDDKRPTFRPNDVNSFLLSTERPLGELKFVRVWHDNSGKQVRSGEDLCEDGWKSKGRGVFRSSG